ncbi:MAG: hypothetical protein IJV98_03815 [Clostridia bacterium]|nr:hypothetical protein [Clostridia bacterium]
MKNKRILTAYLVSAVFVGIGLAVWRTVLLYRYFDPYTGEFSAAAHAPLETYGYVLLACILLTFTASVFLRKKSIAPFTASSSQFSVFASSFLGCLCAASFVLLMIYFPKKLFSAEGTALHRTMLPLTALFLLFTALYFILNASARCDGHRAKRLLGFAPTLFALCYLFAVFTDSSFLSGNSNDRLRCVSLIVLAFFFIQEMRSCFYGKSEGFRFPVSLMTVIVLGAFEIPNLIVTAFWDMDITYMTMVEFTEVGALLLAIATARSMIGAVGNTSVTE